MQLWRPGLWSRFSIRAKLSSHWALQCILGHSFIFCCSFMCTPLELKASPLEKWALACPCSSAAGGYKWPLPLCVCVHKWPYTMQRVISWGMSEEFVCVRGELCGKTRCTVNELVYVVVWTDRVSCCMCLSVWKKCLWREVCAPAFAWVWLWDCDSFHMLSCVICPPHNNYHLCQINQGDFLCSLFPRVTSVTPGS